MTTDQSRPGTPTSPLASDLLWGVKAIAEEIGKTERQASYLVERKMIPAGYVGGQIVSSRSALRRHFAAAVNGGSA